MDLKKMTQNEWEKIKDYLWDHNEHSIQVMRFSNDDDPNVKCVYVKMLHNGEWVSNYFVYSRDVEDLEPLDYALKMVKTFRENQIKSQENLYSGT